MAIRVMQAILTHHCSMRHTSLGHAMRTIWHRFPRPWRWLIAPLILGSCAELIEFRTDIAHLRSDLHANSQILSQLSARVNEIERRQADTESAARQTQQELSQAVEVLLRKALMTENRQSTRDPERASQRKLKNRRARPASSQLRRRRPHRKGGMLITGENSSALA